MSTLSPSTRRWLVPAFSTVAALVALVAFHRPLWAWFGGAASAPPPGPGLTQSVGGLSVTARLDPDPPAQQRNALWLEVHDADGKPVGGAHVGVAWEMPAMGSMAEMKGAADVDEPAPGQYRARFDLPMAGSWGVVADVGAGDHRAHLEYGLTVGTRGLTSRGAGGSAPMAMPAAGAPLPDAFVAKVTAAMDVYEQLRGALAADHLDEARQTALLLTRALAAARAEANDLPPGFAHALQEAEDHARNVGNATELAGARADFGDLSQPLLALAAHDPRLQKGWFVFRCPMEQGYQKWAQRSPRLENPYMGQKMLDCGSPDAFTEPDLPASDGGGAAYYTCSMHPSVHASQPGTCPICGMTLSPVSRASQQSGEVHVDDAARKAIGLRTGKVVLAPLQVAVRALGTVSADESKLVDVTLRVKGYVQDLKVAETGQPVRKGQLLFTLYSPEVFAAEQEYLLALHSSSADTRSGVAAAAEQKLRLWDVSPSVISAIARSGKPLENVPFYSPASGFVLQKDVVQGAAVEPGQRLYRIAPLDEVWVDAEVFEGDLPHVQVGQPATVTLPYLPGKTFTGSVAYVYPTLQGATRTGHVRVVLQNPGLLLKPEMYANVTIEHDEGARLQVPASAVIYTGPRRIVFVDAGGGRLVPHEVTLGARGTDSYEVLSGLKDGDTVVTSGNFLVAAESRLESAAGVWEGGQP